MTATIAIAGRPNVGKSTLFNRLVGQRLALVDDAPGVTRDRRAGEARLADLGFDVIDTAGLEEADAGTLEGRMQKQSEAAILEADLTLFLIDARAGVTPADKGFAEQIRKTGRPVILVANKVEGNRADEGYYEAFGLGFGEPVAISAEHGQGLIDLRDALVEKLGERIAGSAGETPKRLSRAERRLKDREVPAGPEQADERPMQIAVVGRPNAGKSTLINRMIGEERLLTGPEAGITRDSISVEWRWRGRTISLFDTAGMRKKARVREKLEKLAVADGLRAIQFAEVVIILFDATIPFEKQDLHIVDLVAREGRAAVLAFNKWDLIKNRQRVLAELKEKTERLLPQVRGIRFVTISGQTGDGLDRLMEAVTETHKIWNRRVSTARLNEWLADMQSAHPPPAVAGRRIRLKFMTQPKSRPPTFVVMCSRPDALPASYNRYLINQLRRDFSLPGVPVRLFMRKGDNPYAGRKKR